MSNEVDLYSNNGTDVQPYAPSQPIAPAPAPDQLTNREIDNYQRYTGGGQMIFGQPLPAGVSIEQVTQGYQQLGNVFVSDFIKLGHNVSNTQKCVAWFMDAISHPPKQQRQRHSYNLFEHTNDPIFQAFANYAHDNKFPAKMVQDACWWVTEAAKRLGASQDKPQGSAPTNSGSTEAMLSQLSDTDYAKVVAINNKALANTMQVLQSRWGDYTFQQNVQIAQEYLNNLPANEQKHFDQFTTGWVHMRNTPEFITAMFDAATGAHSIGKDGASIAQEIAQCELCMKTNRKQWLADNALQARYRTLLQMRDGS